ncbi:DUF4405 domain-containing protein [Neotabrizicola shimadae]|uniref:DUF4405 domain-containing protein n=1 Tax=Neotabrizicola shimadae TaxID=2807096 RepID=A0A8G0ZTC3_9RHOB|nr:DUF4405 domain-containing protein [Neotabrizicola shimadae]QYZ68280.1 DUF4405 domain-containing protein [Neotabrizicola shimadae]
MAQALQRYATPFITGFFLVSLVTGVALYVHVGPAAFREMHEILSLVLILPFVLHLWKNWRPMLAYFKRAPMIIALAVTLVSSALFFIPSGETGATAGGPPPFALAQAVIARPLADVAPVLGTTAEDLTARLTAAGFTVTGPDEALVDVATGSGKNPMELMAVLVAPAS